MLLPEVVLIRMLEASLIVLQGLLGWACVLGCPPPMGRPSASNIRGWPCHRALLLLLTVGGYWRRGWTTPEGSSRGRSPPRPVRPAPPARSGLPMQAHDGEVRGGSGMPPPKGICCRRPPCRRRRSRAAR